MPGHLPNSVASAGAARSRPRSAVPRGAAPAAVAGPGRRWSDCDASERLQPLWRCGSHPNGSAPKHGPPERFESIQTSEQLMLFEQSAGLDLLGTSQRGIVENWKMVLAWMKPMSSSPAAIKSKQRCRKASVSCVLPKSSIGIASVTTPFECTPAKVGPEPFDPCSYQQISYLTNVIENCENHGKPWKTQQCGQIGPLATAWSLFQARVFVPRPSSFPFSTFLRQSFGHSCEHGRRNASTDVQNVSNLPAVGAHGGLNASLCGSHKQSINDFAGIGHFHFEVSSRNSSGTYNILQRRRKTWGRGWMTKASGVGERRKGRGELRRDCHHRVAALFVPTRMQQWYIDIWYITIIYIYIYMGEGAGGGPFAGKITWCPWGAPEYVLKQEDSSELTLAFVIMTIIANNDKM